MLPAWAEYSAGESSLWEPTLLLKSFIFSFDWLFHVSALLPGSLWFGWSAYLFIPVVPSFSFFFCGLHIRHFYLIGSCWEDCGYGAPADWIFVGMGKQPFLRIRFSLMQSMGEHGSKENTQWVVWVELLPVKSLDAQVLELYFFPVQSEDELTRFCLDFSPGLTFILSLSLSVAADYDVHSLLSSWFWLASNQQQAPVSYHPCYCSPD